MPAENKLSDKHLKSMSGTQSDRQKLVADGRGLSVRVSKAGRISFVFFYRTGDRTCPPVWLTLGQYPDMSLKQARLVRDECRSLLTENKDPRIYLKLKRETELKPVTVKDALEYWIKNYAQENHKNWQRKQAEFERYIYSKIGSMPLSECNTTIWLNLFDDLKKRAPVISGATFLSVRQALRFCKTRRFAINNELNDFRMSDMGKNAEKKDRVLSPSELAEVWSLANKEIGNVLISAYVRTIIIIAISFGCRMHEIRNSTWKEWDFCSWVWTVPKENSKNGRVIIRPIPPQLRQWLVNLKASGKGYGLILGDEYSQVSVSTIIGRLSKKLNHDPSWSLHDFRRTLATRLADKGTNAYVIEQLLGHTLPGVMGIYNRSQYMAEKMEALTWWQDYLKGVTMGLKYD